MGYCTVAQVEAWGTHAGKAYDANSRPTLAQVQAFIDARAREIDSRLSIVGVTTPVSESTSPKAYALLGDLNAIGAAADAQEAAFFRGVAPNKAPENTTVLIRRFETTLLKYAGDGTTENPGNPKLLVDPVITRQSQLWSRASELYAPTSDPPDVTIMPFGVADEF